MNDEARDWWSRAERALSTARMLFSHLASLRLTGDYGGEAHVSTREAGEAADAAARLLEAAREAMTSSR